MTLSPFLSPALHSAESFGLSLEEECMRRLILGLAACAVLLFPLSTVATAADGKAADQLRTDMRKLWTDHVVWTRDYVIAAVGDQPDATAAAARLMKNQEDIGAAIGGIYGKAAGQQLTTLLKDHISIAVDLIKAAKAGDSTAQKQASARWEQNAVQIADFLSKANPNLPRATLVDMMKTHLSTTTDEVVARLKKDWTGDVQAFDRVYDHILHM